ncbi:MAG: hypothetical protein KKC75_08470 [Nanoarchaeota archaeon]|nr:hypothetical protein [Nanoarchaeota archaeon]MBU1005393.1 hypothetical protein [Nanoarchaeota archaeon]MBU1945675.1 hypothetical protein [Nanoarchaeota archaeon]
MEKINFDELEDVKFEIDKKAFEPESLACSDCKIKMKKAEIEVNLEGSISLKVTGFECPKCKKRYLGLSESRKLDKAMIISRMMRNEFKMERSLSFDGDNFTFRIPKEFTHDVKKKKVEVMPLGANQFCASIQ